MTATYLQGRLGALLAASPQPIQSDSQRLQHSPLQGVLTPLQAWQSRQVVGWLGYLLSTQAIKQYGLYPNTMWWCMMSWDHVKG